jgi:pantothenate synthetase
MRLFDKLELYIDYNNFCSVRKALGTLDREFGLAIKSKNQKYALEVINSANQLYNKIQSMSHLYPLNKKTQDFLAYLIKRSKSKFGITGTN